MLLTTFEDLKALLKLQLDSLSDYPALSVIAESVTAAIQVYLCRDLELDSYTERFDMDGERFIGLRAIPIKKIKSVTVDGVPFIGYRQRLDRLEFHSPVNGLLEVKYQGGLDDIPEDIKRAALLQIAHEHQRHDHIGANSVSTDGGSVRNPELGLLKEVRRMLEKHINYAAKGI
jgi:hypothetical protein